MRSFLVFFTEQLEVLLLEFFGNFFDADEVVEERVGVMRGAGLSQSAASVLEHRARQLPHRPLAVHHHPCHRVQLEVTTIVY